MTIIAKKVDSNVTGLRIAYETSIGVLPATPIWYPLEPNSYSDFGPKITTTPRSPINQSRQRKKGMVTDLDASAGFNQDLTQTGMTRHLQGFFFAALREKATTEPMNAAQLTITGVDDILGYEAAAGLDIFGANDLVKASNFGLTANNGVKLVTSSSATGVVVAGLADEAAPPATAKLEKVGHQFAAGDISFALNGNLSRMVSAANALASLGLIPGEWVYVGGDVAATHSDTQKGYARASVVTAGYIEFDKTDWVPAVDAAAGKTIQVFIGSVLRTEDDPTLQKRFTGTMERTVGDAGEGMQAEYVSGCCANTLTINSPQADKITLDIGYVATDASSVSGAEGLKDGTRPALVSTDAFNTSSDFSRIKMSVVDESKSNVTPLFAYLLDLTLNLSNNVSPNKALGVLGAFDTSAGMFTSDGTVTAYFVDTASVKAVRNNTDVTFDIVMAKNNAGMIFDIPLLSLGNGILQVEADQSIKVPLDLPAAQSKFGHTMLYMNFAYLPNAAQ